MRWYLDTEFNEDGRTIDLISIALVSEAGESFYEVSRDFDPEMCNDWVKENVLPKLPPRATWIPRRAIAGSIIDLLHPSRSSPEIWGYFADYDWVALCQLFGSMEALPKGMPFYCRDLKQLMDQAGIAREELPPNGADEHNALADARWAREAHKAIDQILMNRIRGIAP